MAIICIFLVISVRCLQAKRPAKDQLTMSQFLNPLPITKEQRAVLEVATSNRNIFFTGANLFSDYLALFVTVLIYDVVCEIAGNSVPFPSYINF